MATPRKAWFRVPDSVADEDWPDDVLATLIRLQARMNSRWARNGLSASEAAEITLSACDAMAVTRRRSFARASELLRRTSGYVTSDVRVARASVKFSWPKWPIFQGLASRELPRENPEASLESPSPPPPPPPPPQKEEEKKESEPSAPPPTLSSPPARPNGSRHPKASGPRQCLMPKAFEPADWDRLKRLTTRNDLDDDQLGYACRTVYAWSHGAGRMRCDWVLVVTNAIRGGWAMRGYA